MELSKVNQTLLGVFYIILTLSVTYIISSLFHENVFSTQLTMSSLISKSFFLLYCLMPLVASFIPKSIIHAKLKQIFPFIVLVGLSLLIVSVFPSIPTSDNIGMSRASMDLFNGSPFDTVKYGLYPGYLIFYGLSGQSAGVDNFKLYPLLFCLVAILSLTFVYLASKLLITSSPYIPTMMYLVSGSIFSYFILEAAFLGLLLFSIGLYLVLKLYRVKYDEAYAILLILISASIVITHFFASFFWLSILLGIVIGGRYLKIATNRRLFILICLVSILFLIHHLYLGYFVFWSGVWNFNNIIAGSALVNGYNPPTYLGLEKTPFLQVISTINSILRYCILASCLVTLVMWMKSDKRTQNRIGIILTSMFGLGLGSLAMRIFAPSFSDRVFMYAYILFSLFGSYSVYTLLKTEKCHIITRFKMNQEKALSVLFIFILFGLFSHTYGTGVPVTSTELFSTKLLADKGEGNSITCTVDEQEIFYYYANKYPSESSQVKNDRDPVEWGRAFSGQIETDYIILPDTLKQQYYTMRYGCDIPWSDITCSIEKFDRIYSNDKSHIFFIN